MGIGPNVITLFNRMHQEGLFHNINKIIDVGSQNLYFDEDHSSIEKLCQQITNKKPSENLYKAAKTLGAARILYEELGFKYDCIDVDGVHDALTWDLNFDSVLDTHRLAYDMTTNFGTTEHLINQANAFKVIHDLTRPAGLMLHVLPFTGYIDHGYFCYQPNFFESLANYNGYEILGIWTDISSRLNILVPWDKTLVECVKISENNMALYVLLRKQSDTKFLLPFQGSYSHSRTVTTKARYDFVVDGNVVNEKYVHEFMQHTDITGFKATDLIREIAKRLIRKVNKS